MFLGPTEIRNGGSPFIVAEIGAAHNGLLDRALQLMEHAARAGADAIKIQAFAAETITFPGDRPEFTIQNGPWMGQSLWDLYSTAAMPREWYGALFERAKALGIPLFASVFSPEDLSWMETFNCPFYKIASPEIVDVDLIGMVAKTGKPIIISTGMASLDEMAAAAVAVDNAGGDLENISFLHCVSDYPTPIAGAGMRVLSDMMDRMGAVTPIGFSDHTIGREAAVVATVLGAAIIEKHITLSRDENGLDDGFASEPHEFAAMVKAVRGAHASLRTESSVGEESTKALRRSIYVVKDVKAGERFTRDNLRSIRPGNGLPVKDLPSVLGRKSRFAVKAGQPMSRNLVEEM